MENVKKQGHIKLLTTEKRRNYLVSEPSYQSTNSFTEPFLAIDMNKTQVFMNNSVYLGLSMLELRKILMYEFW